MAKGQIETIPYDRFSLALHQRVLERRTPVQGSIELTSRCNLNCVHCYINLPITDADARARQLGTSEIFRILDEIAEQGCLWLLLTGGEPLLRKDFEEIYRYAKKSGFILTLFTNATLLTDKVADFLVEWRPFNIEVTIYGRTRETFEAVTRRPGSFDRCIRGIQCVLDRHLPLTLKSMVMELNKHEVAAMQEFAESLGVKFRFDPMLNKRADGNPGPESYRPSPEETVDIDLAFKERRSEWTKLCERVPNPQTGDDKLFICGAGMNHFNITADGKLCVCLLYRAEYYDLRQGSFAEGWQNFFPSILAKKRTRPSKCSNCPLMVMCGQCPGWADLEHCDPEAPVDYLCRIAHLRAERLNSKGTAT